MVDTPLEDTVTSCIMPCVILCAMQSLKQQHK